MSNDQQVVRNLKGMDDLDFEGWNNADWHGVFAHHHTDDVVVDWKGQEPTRGIQQHIDAMRAYVDLGLTTSASPALNGAPRGRSSIPTRCRHAGKRCAGRG
jgi:hypothetical protein